MLQKVTKMIKEESLILDAVEQNFLKVNDNLLNVGINLAHMMIEVLIE